ncbi:ribosome biogenesis regulatory protein homolog isoform X2 [Hydra vulgaris]|uniref:Ribosome biogenesis regulatory protein n=1 Tax=Hydra vulgaris TaxID=6087 RepID=A0ABM4CD23_HYDVU
MTSSEVDTVSQIVANQRENESKFKSIDVFKEVDPVIDLGNLLLLDLQPVNSDELKSKSEQFLIELARDNAQLLFNQIWKLPIERLDNIVLAKLPEPSTLLPREKPIPKPKPPTKWEIYAKKKGIEKKKRSRMLWDEESKTWKPRHGYKRTKDDTKEWCIEVPQNADPNEDQFEKKEIAKKERVAKNEIKRLGNIARNTKKGTVSSLQFKPTLEKDKTRVSKEIDVAKLSTASMGKFQPKLPHEKENKKTGQKRKFESVSGNGINEKQRALDILKKINKPGKLDLTKAVNKKVYENKESSSKLSSGKVKNKRFRKGKQATLDKMKSRTLGKGKKRR